MITVGGEGADIGGEDGDVDDDKKQVINMVHSFGLQPTRYRQLSHCSPVLTRIQLRQEAIHGPLEGVLA